MYVYLFDFGGGVDHNPRGHAAVDISIHCAQSELSVGKKSDAIVALSMTLTMAMAMTWAEAIDGRARSRSNGGGRGNNRTGERVRIKKKRGDS